MKKIIKIMYKLSLIRYIVFSQIVMLNFLDSFWIRKFANHNGDTPVRTGGL